jgi:hypothetical protein
MIGTSTRARTARMSSGLLMRTAAAPPATAEAAMAAMCSGKRSGSPAGAWQLTTSRPRSRSRTAVSGIGFLPIVVPRFMRTPLYLAVASECRRTDGDGVGAELGPHDRQVPQRWQQMFGGRGTQRTEYQVSRVENPSVIAEAVRLGLDCVEHGYQLTPDVAAEMAGRRTALVPTLVVTRCKEFFDELGVPEWMQRRSLDAGHATWRATRWP